MMVESEISQYIFFLVTGAVSINFYLVVYIWRPNVAKLRGLAKRILDLEKSCLPKEDAIQLNKILNEKLFDSIADIKNKVSQLDSIVRPIN